MSLPGLQGKTVVVTGGGQGIGRAYARRFGQEGCRVVIADVNAERGEAVAEEVREDGGEALFVPCDVGDSASCTAMAQAAQTRFGRIDGLVNNAAIFSTIQMKPFWEIEEADWDRLLTVNVKGPWLCSRAVLPGMRAAGRGSIVNISSGAYWLARPGYAHYITSKAAILGLTRAMARELGEAHIRVNAITPGPIYTEVPRETVTPAQQQAMLEAQCLKRLPGPDDLVGTVAFLISDDSGWITGQTINVDGGLAFP